MINRAATFEEIAAADKERYSLEMRRYQQEMDERDASAHKGKRGPGKRSIGSTAARDALSSPTAPTADVETGGAFLLGDSTIAASGESSGKRHRTDANGTPDSFATAKSRPQREESQFPMDDTELLRREKAHRAMLVASGRSKASNVADLHDSHPDTSTDDAEASPLAPAYVYPPRGPPPTILPPLPSLPTPAPLPLPQGLTSHDHSRLLMVWDFCNVVGYSFKLKPTTLPYHAMTNAIAGGSAVDEALLGSLSMAMLRVLARDVVGVDGWASWVRAVDDALLHLIWPQLLAHLLELDQSYATVSKHSHCIALSLECLTRGGDATAL